MVYSFVELWAFRKEDVRLFMRERCNCLNDLSGGKRLLWPIDDPGARNVDCAVILHFIDQVFVSAGKH